MVVVLQIIVFGFLLCVGMKCSDILLIIVFWVLTLCRHEMF